MYTVRPNASALRREVEESLTERAPAALTPRVRSEPELMTCGIRMLDDCLRGGLPIGAVTELIGEECSGRTTVAQAYVAAATQNGSVAAWVDVDDVFDPESATRGGVDCERLLWVRCGRELAATPDISTRVPTQMQGEAVAFANQLTSHRGGSPHPRSEGHGMSEAIKSLLLAQPRSGATAMRRRDKSIGTPGAPNRPLQEFFISREEQIATDRLPPRRGEQLKRVVQPARCAEPQLHARKERDRSSPQEKPVRQSAAAPKQTYRGEKKSWSQLDQALRATDLLLQSGGFSVIVLDLGSTPPEMSWRVPLASWFRYRAACERTRSSLLLLTKHPCAKSSAELIVRMQTGTMDSQGGVLTGIQFRSEIERQRFQKPISNVVSIRKPPQSERPGTWSAKATWAL